MVLSVVVDDSTAGVAAFSSAADAAASLAAFVACACSAAAFCAAACACAAACSSAFLAAARWRACYSAKRFSASFFCLMKPSFFPCSSERCASKSFLATSC